MKWAAIEKGTQLKLIVRSSNITGCVFRKETTKNTKETFLLLPWNKRPLTGENSVDYGSAIDSDDGLDNDDIKLNYRDFVMSSKYLIVFVAQTL